MTFDLEYLIDMPWVQKLFDNHFRQTGISSALIGLEGKIHASSGWQDICAKFHVENPDTAKKCALTCQYTIESYSPDKSYICHPCPLGLMHLAVPVKVDGEHVANLLNGQFLIKEPDSELMDRFSKQANEFGFEEGAYIEALTRVPVISEDKLDSIINSNLRFVEMTGEMADFYLKEFKAKEEIQKAYKLIEDAIKLRIAETDKLAQIIEANAIPTFVVDTTGRVTHWNNACELLTGYKTAEMIGTTKHQDVFLSSKSSFPTDLFFSKESMNEATDCHADKFKGLRHSDEVYEGDICFQRIGSKAKILFCTATPLKNTEGSVTGSICVLQDMTDKRLAEKELVQTEERYRHLFESANDAIFLSGRKSFIDCNQKAIELLSCQRDYIIGKKPADISPEKQPTGLRSKELTSAYKEKTFNNGRNFFEWRFLRKDGSIVDAEVSATSLVISGQLCLLAIVRDITERNLLIDALRQREAELDEKNRYLEKVNQALKATIENREIEIRAVEQSILTDFKNRVMPYLDDMARLELTAEAKSCLNIIERNLKDLFSPFSKNLFSKFDNFTPTEIKITDLIRTGRGTKEIADILGLAPSSVQWHRKNIREKLEITNKKTGLRSYLKSIS